MEVHVILNINPEFVNSPPSYKMVSDSVLGFTLRTFLLVKQRVESIDCDLSKRIDSLEFQFDERDNCVLITAIITMMISKDVDDGRIKSHVAACQMKHVDTADNLAIGYAEMIVSKVRESIRTYPPQLRVVGDSSARPN
jgi:hypothetical protein